MSPNSIEKRGFVQKELRIALDILDQTPPTQVFIIPVRLAECRPTHRALSELQWVDLFPNWDIGIRHLGRLFGFALRNSEQGDLSGTTWAACESIGTSWTLVYRDATIVHTFNHDTGFRETGSRRQNGALVYADFNQIHAQYRGTLEGDVVNGEAQNILGETWTWHATKISYRRNGGRGAGSLPGIAFLHGNVLVGVCHVDKVCGLNGDRCSKCGTSFVPSQLLYPVKHKDYTSDLFIASEWERLRDRLSRAYFLSIFGYSAPKTDVEARDLMLDVWRENHHLELAEVEIIDIKPRDELEATWDEFFVKQHYMVGTDVSRSYLFQHPRRSCDAFAAATLMCNPWQDNPFPVFGSLTELQDWVRPLIEEEARLEEIAEPFSGKPLAPNVEATF